MGHIRQKCLQTCAKCLDSDHLAHVQSIMQAFALHSYILKHPMILLADSEGSDENVQNCRLIWAFTAHISRKTRFHMAQHIVSWRNKKTIDIIIHIQALSGQGLCWSKTKMSFTWSDCRRTWQCGSSTRQKYYISFPSRGLHYCRRVFEQILLKSPMNCT